MVIIGLVGTDVDLNFAQALLLAVWVIYISGPKLFKKRPNLKKLSMQVIATPKYVQTVCMKIFLTTIKTCSSNITLAVV